jgi:hypothetical protein
MGGFALLGRKALNLEESPHPIHLQPKELHELVRSKQVPWPEVDENDVEARSKADWLVKLLALAQILWFVIQIISRAIQGLEITTLELFTQGIVFCAIILYGLWWDKPFDVQQPLVIQAKDSVPQVSTLIVETNLSLDKIDTHKSDPWWFRPSSLAVCLGFGALHLVAWNFYFPTEAERWLWRVSSLGCIVLPIGIAVSFMLHIEDAPDIYVFLTFGSMALYFLFRFYMFVEMFVSLRSVPASVYQTPEWSQYFPSFG